MERLDSSVSSKYIVSGRVRNEIKYHIYFYKENVTPCAFNPVQCVVLIHTRTTLRGMVQSQKLDQPTTASYGNPHLLE